MPSMLTPRFYTKRILAARDPVTFADELIKYTGFLSSRATYMNQMFREGIQELDVNKMKKAVTPIIFQ